MLCTGMKFFSFPWFKIHCTSAISGFVFFFNPIWKSFSHCLYKSCLPCVLSVFSFCYIMHLLPLHNIFWNFLPDFPSLCFSAAASWAISSGPFTVFPSAMSNLLCNSPRSISFQWLFVWFLDVVFSSLSYLPFFFLSWSSKSSWGNWGRRWHFCMSEGRHWPESPVPCPWTSHWELLEGFPCEKLGDQGRKTLTLVLGLGTGHAAQQSQSEGLRPPGTCAIISILRPRQTLLINPALSPI